MQQGKVSSPESMTAPAAHAETCDVFVLGGGPAGSTAAALLAERGWKVVVAEKDRHPRFHIGESLLPMNLPLLDRLGVRERVERIAMLKYGAEFNSPRHRDPVTFEFCGAWDKSHPYSYEVRRAEFDEILFRNCVARGARAFEQTRVTNVEFDAGREVLVRTRDPDGNERRWRARFLVDASGRDTYLANQFGIKHRNRKHNSAAIFGHFAGAKRLPGKAEGNISIFWFDHGWFWFIPLKEDVTSIGAVCWPYYMKSRSGDPQSFLLDTIRLCPTLAERLRDARLVSPVTATGNYSYFSERMYGERYLLLGDAFAFVDPVFSSGVMLAMNSAFLGAEAIDAWLRDPRSALPALKNFDREVRHGLRHFSWFIYRMTNPAIRELFMAPRNVLRIQEALVALLAGDLFRGTPIYWSLRAFKAVYFLTCAMSPLRSLRAWRRRRQILRNPQSDAAS